MWIGTFRGNPSFSTDTEQKKTKAARHTPAAVMQVLQKNLGLTTEIFATPLDHDPQIPQYFSSQPEVRVFGANLDGLSTVWEGASHCQPETEHYEIEKAVRSALDTDYPSLTSLNLAKLPQQPICIPQTSHAPFGSSCV